MAALRVYTYILLYLIYSLIIMNSLQQVMSQIASVRWQESEKLIDATNFSIWASVLNIKAAQFGPLVQAYIKEGMVLTDDIEVDKVKIALDSICHTLVTGGLNATVMEEVLYNQWYGREVLVNLQKLFGTIGVEAAVIMAKSLTTGKWRNGIQSKREYNKFFNEFYCNVLKVYSPEQVAAIFYAASITDATYGERVLGTFSDPKRLTLTDAKVMANHLGDEAFAGSGGNVALVANGKDSFRKFRKRKVTCYRCQKKGHLASECLSTKPVPKDPDAAAAVAVSTSAVEAAGLCQADSGFAWSLKATGTSILDGNCFYFDSGATLHICTNSDWFTKLEPKDGKIAGLGNATVDIKGIGVVKFTNGAELNDVLFAPNAANLISISAATKRGGSFSFVGDGAFLNGLRVGTRVSSGLYQAELAPVQRALVTTHWHERLGHPGETATRAAAKTYGFDVEHNGSCDACQIGKAVKIINKVASRLAAAPLGLLHADIVGPFPVPLIDESRFYLTIVDDFSRFVTVVPLPNRGVAVSRLIYFVKHTQKLLNKSVHTIRTDNEFATLLFRSFCDEQGIKHERSVPYESHQNGVAERWQRTITAKARTLLIDANAPDYLWSEAVMCAAYLLNLLPSRGGTGGESPYELFHKRKPDVRQLRVFGCAAYGLVPIPIRNTKLGDTSVLCVMVGYDDTRKAYRLFNPNTNSVVVSATCRFDEAAFPFKDEGFAKVQVLMPKAIGITPAVPGAMGGKVKDINIHVVSPSSKEPNHKDSNSSTDADPIIDISSDDEDLQAAQDAAHEPEVDQDVSQRVDVGKSDIPLHGDPNDAIDQLTGRLEHDDNAFELNATVNPPVAVTDATTPADQMDQLELELTKLAGLKRTLLEDNDRFENVLKWFTDVDRNTIKDRNPLAILAAAMIAANTTKGDTTNPIWKEACLQELGAMEDNKTFSLVRLPAGKRAVGCRWVFTMKDGPNGEFAKARLVAQGFSQREGIDYNETFSPVIRYDSVRVLLAVAASRQFKVHQMDVTTAFLHGDIDAEIYMKQPPGFEDAKKADYVWKLHKSIYGLKQSPLCWYNKMLTALEHFGFQKASAEHGVFYLSNQKGDCMLGLYVDDLIIAGSTMDAIDNVKKYLATQFRMKYLGLINGRFLGLDVKLTKAGLVISMDTYIKDMIGVCGLEGCHKEVTPMMLNPYKLVVVDPGEELDEEDATRFRSIIGMLLFAANCLRYDICFAVGLLSRFLSKPHRIHLSCAKRVLRYLSGTPLHISYGANDSVVLAGYTDSDWAGDVGDRKSIGGYMFTINGKPVTWSSKKQASVALLTCEAEYVALTEVIKEYLFLQLLFRYIGTDIKMPVIYCDNNSAINLAKHPTNHRNSKHISIRFHFVRDLVNIGFVLERVDTKANVSDMMTKALALPLLKPLLTLLQ